MPDIRFSHKELAALLVKQAGVRTGVWGISLQIACLPTNVTDSATGQLRPGVINVVQDICLTSFKELNDLSVDAAEVWRTEEWPDSLPVST